MLQLWLAATKVTASPPELPDAGHLASLSVQAREFLEIELIHEGYANTKTGSLTFRLVLRSVAIYFLTSEISVWVERRPAPARRADAGKRLMEPPLQLVNPSGTPLLARSPLIMTRSPGTPTVSIRGLA